MQLRIHHAMLIKWIRATTISALLRALHRRAGRRWLACRSDLSLADGDSRKELPPKVVHGGPPALPMKNAAGVDVVELRPVLQLCAA